MANPSIQLCSDLFDDDKKDVTASTLFEIHHGKIIMVSSQDFLGVPPKERNHWQK
jgi:hypothetical protein